MRLFRANLKPPKRPPKNARWTPGADRTTRSNPALSGTGFGPLSHRIDQAGVRGARSLVCLGSINCLVWWVYAGSSIDKRGEGFENVWKWFKIMAIIRVKLWRCLWMFVVFGFMLTTWLIRKILKGSSPRRVFFFFAIWMEYVFEFTLKILKPLTSDLQTWCFCSQWVSARKLVALCWQLEHELSRDLKSNCRVEFWVRWDRKQVGSLFEDEWHHYDFVLFCRLFFGCSRGCSRCFDPHHFLKSYFKIDWHPGPDSLGFRPFLKKMFLNDLPNFCA